MKWFTCTPVAFGGGEDFFARDSGLLSRGFRAIGVESRAVMPGERKPEDLEELIRTDYAHLESAGWWKSQGLDGVVLYAWGRPKFRKVAQAIRSAGIRLVLNQDSGGLVGPRCGFKSWVAEQRILSGAGRVPGGWIGFAKLACRGLTLGLVVTDPLRAFHLRQGDRIAAVSPKAAEHYQKLCASYVGGGTEDRVVFVPHPVDPRFTAASGTRDRRVIAVGRWHDERQKRTSLLMAVLETVLREDPHVGVDLVGNPGEVLPRWHRAMPVALRDRVRLHGRTSPDRVREFLRQARVAYCPSAFESFHIASAEALCSGCSVVAGRSVSMASFEWFVGDGDGRLAETDDREGHAETLLEELSAWDRGERSPVEIGERWSARLHAPRVAMQVIALFD